MRPPTDKHASYLPNVWHIAVGAALRRIRCGEITLDMPGGRHYRFAGPGTGPVAHIDVRDASVARRIVTGGSVALAEGYMDGQWDTPDLNAVLDFGLANISAGWVTDVPPVMRPVHRLWHAMRDNDPRGGAKRNIAYHYDLGNDFYGLWLDDTLTYSAACFDKEDGLASPGEQLECAQIRKWDRILDLLQPTSRDHILEIGCGWGGFAMHAAREAGCRVTGITLSDRQAELARERVMEHGLDGRVDIRLQDYREIGGTYSGIASIEMFEAVGEKWWPTFFRRVRELLEPGAAAALQVITIADDTFEAYRRRPDFIQRYIFPGGQLPSPERFRSAAEDGGLSVAEPRFFGMDYVKTLAAWSERFEAAVPEIATLGFDSRFIRMWRYYLAYCRTGFSHGRLDVMQVRLEP